MAHQLLKFRDRDNFFAHIARIFRKLQLFTDVQIQCSDGTLKAHRLILSTASPFMKRLLLDSEDQECSILIMKDFSCKVMEALFSFLYTGRCVLSSMHAGELHALTTNIGMNVNNIDCDLGPKGKEIGKYNSIEEVKHKRDFELQPSKESANEKPSKRIRLSVRPLLSAESGSTTSHSSSLVQSSGFHHTPTIHFSVHKSTSKDSNYSICNSELPRAQNPPIDSHRSSVTKISPKPQVQPLKHSPISNHFSVVRQPPFSGHPNFSASKPSHPNKATSKAFIKREKKGKSEKSVSLSPRKSPEEVRPKLSPSSDLSGSLGLNQGRLRSKGKPKTDLNDDDSQVCGLCACVDPPSATTSQTKWVGCDCDRWFHLRCLRLEEVPRSFNCSKLNKKCLPKSKGSKIKHHQKLSQDLIEDTDDDIDDDDDDEYKG